MSEKKRFPWLISVLVFGSTMLTMAFIGITVFLVQSRTEKEISALRSLISEWGAEPTREVLEIPETPEVPAANQGDLIAPFLHHADSNPPEAGYGSFDIGVNSGQIGLVFGWHVRWPKGGLDAGGEGCDLVILAPGWYEDLQILDGRYEVYDVPAYDYSARVEILGQQRANEQTANYSCPAKEFDDIPIWD
jgi:hypothetical protein